MKIDGCSHILHESEFLDLSRGHDVLFVARMTRVLISVLDIQGSPCCMQGCLQNEQHRGVHSGRHSVRPTWEVRRNFCVCASTLACSDSCTRSCVEASCALTSCPSFILPCSVSASICNDNNSSLKRPLIVSTPIQCEIVLSKHSRRLGFLIYKHGMFLELLSD